MALICPNPPTVGTEGKALFVVFGNYLFKLRPTQRQAVAIGAPDQFINLCPAVLIEASADLFRTVAQHQAEKLTDADEFALFHLSVRR